MQRLASRTLILTLLLSGTLLAQETTPEASAVKPGSQIETSAKVTLGERDAAKTAEVHYLLSLPENYEQQKKCPVLIFLHGRGEWGSDLDRVKKHGPPKLVKEKNTTPFIIVSPQSPRGEWWRTAKLSKLLDHILATTKADTNRVYLTGLSMGGFATWSWIAEEPHRFAAAIPVCGGGNPANGPKLVDLPLWVFHGAKDTVVPLSRSEVMVNAIKAASGKKIKFTIYPEANHDSWTETYNNPEIYKWLLQHELKPPAE